MIEASDNAPRLPRRPSGRHAGETGRDDHRSSRHWQAVWAQALAILGSALALGGLLAPADARAWGGVGHEIICELAYERLSDAGRALVDDIRAAGGMDEPADFHETCIWPDKVRRSGYRGTRQYHFLNAPKGAPSIDLARDCDALDCVPVAVQRYAAIVAREPLDLDSARRERAEALRFLGHFVGDLHQPLHIGHNEDLGGNRLRVTWFGDDGSFVRPIQLHYVWDVKLPERAGYGSPESAATLKRRLERHDASAWMDFDLIGWTAESRALGEIYAYRHADGSDVRTGDDLAQEYFDHAWGAAELQLMRAAVRLAYLIDAAADGSLPRNMVGLTPAVAEPTPSPDALP